MRRALRLAERGRGQTSPNPMVGAIVVLPDGTIVGDGYHEQAGTPHAEVHALDEAGGRARGATLICTLEPCCHHGRTGPCVERIVAAGIKRGDCCRRGSEPAGRGRRVSHICESHGVAVTVGVEAGRARQLNAPFFTRDAARPAVRDREGRGERRRVRRCSARAVDRDQLAGVVAAGAAVARRGGCHRRRRRGRVLVDDPR